MDFRAVLILCTQLWVAFAKRDCPEECLCVDATFGGLIAICEQLNVKQAFPNTVHYLKVTNAKQVDFFQLESNFFQKIHLEDLQSVKIVNSSLSNVNEYAFADMNNLNYVDLSDNKLSRIHPDTFKNNSNLQQLSLSGNVKLSQTLAIQSYFLKSLTITDLDLSRCNIREISSEAFNELPNLTNLNLESNYIHLLSYYVHSLSTPVFEKLEYLEEINLSNNYITDIDAQTFVDFEDLTTLKLSNNSISKFDNVVFSSLKELDLSYNEFTTLESTTLEGSQDVSNVNFSHNKIEKIDEDTFTDLNELRYLDLSYNDIKGPLPQYAFETNEDLETLSLAHNPKLLVFSGFSGEFKKLYRLDISYCGLNEIKEEAFENLQHISTLDLSGNLLADLDSRAFIKLTRLNNLDLSDNQITTLPDDLFQGNMDLRKLSLRGNNILHLPVKLFQPAKHLTILDVSSCQLSYLWTMVESDYMQENHILSQLNYFNLDNNKFKTLHKNSFKSMTSLKALDISKNSFQCDEHFILFIEWLVQEKATPGRYIGKSSADMEQEHAQLHWESLLEKVCANPDDANSKEKFNSMVNRLGKTVKPEKTTKMYENIINNDVEKDIFKHYKEVMKEVDKAEDLKKLVPDISYASKFGLEPVPAMNTSSPNDSEYPWVWPLFLILICGVSTLLALFNLAALLLYRTGKNYNKVAGYRSTFITPLSGQLKFKRDAGSIYHKLYEECSVPNTVPIVKQPDDFAKSVKKNAIVISGVTKGEDMV